MPLYEYDEFGQPYPQYPPRPERLTRPDPGELAAAERLRLELEECRGLLADAPTHADLDAAVFHANVLRGQLSRTEAALREYVEIHTAKVTATVEKNDLAWWLAHEREIDTTRRARDLLSRSE